MRLDLLKSYYLIFSILFIPTIIITGPKSIALYQDVNLFPTSTNSDVNQIIWPSLANPTTATNGSMLNIRFQTNYSFDPVEVRVFNQFLEYTQPVLSTTPVGITNEQISMINIPTEIKPFLYSFELIFSNWEKIESFNSLLIRRSDYFKQDQAYSFIHITDIHVDGSEQRFRQISQLFAEINLINPDFVILTGDFVDGLTSDENGGMVTAKVQFPQGIDLLKKLKIPILVINGNHDFQTNQWQNGNHLWEEHLGPLDNLVIFSYSNDTYVGANLLNEDGLSAGQLMEINHAFENATSLRVFFAHYDYQNQFPPLYNTNSIDLTLLGHTHSSSIDTISGTTEVTTDNSITLIESEPGHYKLFSISESKEVDIQEFEVEKLFSQKEVEILNQSTLLVKITIENYHKQLLENITERVILTGDWSQNIISGIGETSMLFNGSHTLLTVQFRLESMTESNFSLLLSSFPSENYWNIIKTPIEVVTSSTGTKETTNSTTIKRNSGMLYWEIIILVFLAITLIKKRRGI
jgi:predicted MPP superfamily phosphohydrolase